MKVNHIAIYYNVLLSCQLLLSFPGTEIEFDPKCKQLIEKFLDEYGDRVDIILTSTWRRHSEGMKLLRRNSLTVHRAMYGSTAHSERLTTRGEEIKDWIDAHKFNGKYVIIDDEPYNLLKTQLPFTVATQTYEGLQESDIEKIKQILYL